MSCPHCAMRVGGNCPNLLARAVWRCAAPAGPHLDTCRLRAGCRNERFAFRRVLALGVYDGLASFNDLRGKHRPHGGPLMVSATDLFIERSTSDLLTDLRSGVPVPHRHWRHRFWRMHTRRRLSQNELQCVWNGRMFPICCESRKPHPRRLWLRRAFVVDSSGAFRRRQSPISLACRAAAGR